MARRRRRDMPPPRFVSTVLSRRGNRLAGGRFLVPRIAPPVPMLPSESARSPFIEQTVRRRAGGASWDTAPRMQAGFVSILPCRTLRSDRPRGLSVPCSPTRRRFHNSGAGKHVSFSNSRRHAGEVACRFLGAPSSTKRAPQNGPLVFSISHCEIHQASSQGAFWKQKESGEEQYDRGDQPFRYWWPSHCRHQG